MLTEYITNNIAKEWIWPIQEHRLTIIETRGVKPLSYRLFELNMANPKKNIYEDIKQRGIH